MCCLVHEGAQQRTNLGHVLVAVGAIIAHRLRCRQLQPQTHCFGWQPCGVVRLMEGMVLDTCADMPDSACVQETPTAFHASLTYRLWKVLIEVYVDDGVVPSSPAVFVKAHVLRRWRG